MIGCFNYSMEHFAKSCNEFYTKLRKLIKLTMLLLLFKKDAEYDFGQFLFF